MTVAAQFSTEASQDDLNRVLNAISEYDLIVAHEPRGAEEWSFEIRTDDSAGLKQFYEVCVEHDLTVNVQRIRHGPTATAAPEEAGLD